MLIDTAVQAPVKPRVGVIGLAYPGYNLGEEMGEAKLREMLAQLGLEHLEVVPAGILVIDEATARRAGDKLAAMGVDCLLAVITTFVPDGFIVELLKGCNLPIFLWAVEREIDCLSLVSGPMITATLYNLEKPYALYGADIRDEATLACFHTFARAAMLRRTLSNLRVGFLGGRCPIMLSLAVDEDALTERLGVQIIAMTIEEFYAKAQAVTAAEASSYWSKIVQHVGHMCVREEEGVLSARYALASFALAEQYKLDALSLNCFPHLKSQVCLAVARLNDAGIAAACEGDLHSTILMALLQRLSGRPAFNGDFLRLYPETNSVLFSHCGAGALTLASCTEQVCLQASIETCDGVAVKYPTYLPGPVTLVNMMMGNGKLRMAAMAGEGVDTDLTYEGTPLRVRFDKDIQTILQQVAHCGAGHHWNGAPGNYLPELNLLCTWLGLPFNALTDDVPVR